MMRRERARLSRGMAGLCAMLMIASSWAQEPATGAEEEAAAKEPTYAPEPKGYWTGALNGPVPETLTGGKVIRLAELQTLLKHGNVVTVDVSNKPRRPEGLPKSSPWLPLPQQVIPGSVWIPGAGMGAIEPAVEKVFRKRLETISANNLTFPIVIYCHERCWLSWNAAKRAVGYGYRNVYWFPDGIEGWKAAGYPTVEAKPAEPKRAQTAASTPKPKESKPATPQHP